MKNEIFDQADRLILKAVQEDFPVDMRPYEVIARNLNELYGCNLSEKEVVNRVNNLKEKGFIRRLGAIFNPAPLGYRSTLCAAKVPLEMVLEFASLVSAYSQVTHNYLRNDEYNIWFTFCYRDPHELADFLNSLKDNTGITDIHEMEAIKVYKIKAVFNVA